MDNESNGSANGDYSLTGMERPCKLFISIDSEGYLTDSVAISDVANFDCYETIVDSAKRIIALFSKCQPSDITVTSMFYYKKRNRSTRMNPSPLLTTTDVFRAVAEHPKGEVPIGVQWSLSSNVQPLSVVKTTNRSDIRPVVKQINAATNTRLEPDKKKRKVEHSSNYKTYMPNATSEVTTTTASKSTHTVVSEKKLEEVWVKPKTPVHQMKDMMAKESAVEKLELLKKGYNATFNKDSRVNYHWNDNVSCEVLFNYDGVTERRKLSPDLTEKVEKLLRGQNCTLISGGNEYINCDNPQADPQELLNDANMNHSIPKPDRKPIKSLRTAKQEIFNILSVLQLSKARFKRLMAWMRSLKLEEGNQGKFYLSERNVIGHGLQICYDTDEQAAKKLLQLHKSRLKTNKNKIGYPTSAMPPPPYSTVLVSSEQAQTVQTHTLQTLSGQSLSGQPQPGQIMLMVPSSNVNAVTSSGNVVTTVSNNGQTQSLIPLTVLNPVDKGSGSDTNPVKVKGPTPTPSMLKKVPRIPNILNRSKSPSMSAHSKDPVPVSLFKSSVNKCTRDMTTGNNSKTDDNNDDDTTLPVVVKQEKIDDDESCDNTADDDNDTLNDESISLVIDHPELDMKVVVKTEPVDDFGD